MSTYLCENYPEKLLVKCHLQSRIYAEFTQPTESNLSYRKSLIEYCWKAKKVWNISNFKCELKSKNFWKSKSFEELKESWKFGKRKITQIGENAEEQENTKM